MIENKRSTVFTVVGYAEIIMGFSLLLFSLVLIWYLLLIGVIMALVFLPTSNLLIKSGFSILQLKAEARKCNTILFWVLGALCLSGFLLGFPCAEEVTREKIVINIIPSIFVPLELLLGYILFSPNMKEQFE